MNRALVLMLAALAAAASAGAAPATSVLERRADGRLVELRGPVAGAAGPEAALAFVESLGSLVRDPGDGTELRVIDRRESLTGTHVRMGQFVGNEPVLGGEIVVRYDRRGELAGLSNALGILRPEVRALATAPPPAALEGKEWTRAPIFFADDGLVRRAIRYVVPDPPFGSVAWDVDPATGAVIRIVPDYAFVHPARVFEANPVTTLNDASLRDEDDAALAVPETAYAEVVLHDLAPDGGLRGPRVEIHDLDSPKTTPASSSGTLHFDRSIAGFEEVMAYYHLDGSIRWLETLGYSGSRAIFTTPLRADPHAAGGADQSYYRWGPPGQAAVLFGDGGVDDAEDPDILLHELGHAIQDAIAPFAFATSYATQARAMGEGFGDYWAFSAGYAASLQSGRDPFCIGDWDARCSGTPSCGYPPGADCLRRVDGAKTMAGYEKVDQSGVEHRNGEIWSSALREVFLAAVARDGHDRGRAVADTIMIESHFGIPPSPSFRAVGRRMLEADRILFGGSNAAAICTAMESRGIFGDGDCDLQPRGEFTLHPAPQAVLPIPDADGAGLRSTIHLADERRIVALRVPVHIRHPFRGELRITLTAPDGRSAVLAQPTGDSGADIVTVYGFDADPHEPLAAFSGMSARGTWTLTVVDTRSDDVGTLVGWALDIHFEGDAPMAARARTSAPTLHLPAVARTPGAEGTFFVSDARLLNASDGERRVTAFLTPSGADGATAFAARALVLAPGQQLALDDLVLATFRTAGTGAVELRGDTEGLLVTSRTYNDAADGTYGQFVPSTARASALRPGGPAQHILALRNDDAFRSNLGFAELAGESGAVEWRLFDGAGRAIDEGSVWLEPWSHAQMPILGGRAGTHHAVVRAEVRVASGGARVAAYGSIVDNATGDGVFVPARDAFDAGPRLVPAVIRSPGAFDTTWRSDLFLANLGAESGELSLRWIAAGGATEERTVSLAGGASVAIGDVLLSLFGAETGTGVLQIDGALASWGAAARAWTGAAEASFGQNVAVAGAADGVAAGEGALVIPHLIESAAFRTNIGFAELGAGDARVRLRIFDASGAAVWETEVAVPSGELRQVSLAAAGAPAVANGYAVAEVVGGGGRVVAYGSVIDNRSGDPMYVPGMTSIKNSH